MKKNKKYSHSEKKEYYAGRLKDKNLTKGQAEYSEGFYYGSTIADYSIKDPSLVKKAHESTIKDDSVPRKKGYIKGYTGRISEVLNKNKK